VTWLAMSRVRERARQRAAPESAAVLEAEGTSELVEADRK
jgi:hypothetical protein